MTTETSNEHAVFATDHQHNTYRVSDPMEWDAAQNEWQRLDSLLRAGRMPHVKFYEVRGVKVTVTGTGSLAAAVISSHGRYDDAPLSFVHRTPVIDGSRGYADSTAYRAPLSGRSKAARKAWNRRFPNPDNPSGIQGMGGWYYYSNGRTAAQGLGHLGMLCERMGLITEGNGRWYVLDV